MQKHPVTIEIATTDFASTKAAVEGGADRIELCAALSEGGITPSHGLLKKARESFDVPLFPIIRPRAGDFLYSKEAFEIMIEDVKLCRSIGCDGIVSGFLLPDGNIDVKRTAFLIDLAYPMEFTFHRAFDRCADPFAALDALIDIGCQRILTSGQRTTALEGIQLIRELVKLSSGRMIILPGSGVRKENAKQILEETGATEIHTSLRASIPSRMEFKHHAFESSKESYTHNGIIAEEVKEFRKSLA